MFFYAICILQSFNPFTQNKILDPSKLKAVADDKLNVTKLIFSVFDRVENIVRKGKIVCTSNFSFSLNDFKSLLSQTRQKVSLCGNGLIATFQLLCVASLKLGWSQNGISGNGLNNFLPYYGSLCLLVHLLHIAHINSLPNNKIFDRSKLKAFADDKIDVIEKLKIVLGRIKNIVGKGENAGYQHFLLFPHSFQKAFFSGSLTVEIVW